MSIMSTRKGVCHYGNDECGFLGIALVVVGDCHWPGIDTIGELMEGINMEQA